MAGTYVSQKAVIVNRQKKFLILRRTSTAPSNPDKWDLPGGDIDFGEEPIAGIAREIKEETGLSVSELEPFDVYSRINEKGEFWVTIAYKAKAKSGKIKLSSEHDEFKWVTKKKFLKLSSFEKIKQFVEKV